MMATRRKLYAEETRRALLASAREGFGARGFRETSIAEIAAGANVSPGAVYKHFETKEELFYQVAEALQRDVFDEVGKRIALLSDPHERLREARTTYLEACERPDFRRIVCIDYASAVGEERWRQSRPSYTVLVLRDLLEALAADGRLRLPATEAVAHMIFGALTEASRWMATARRRGQARDEITGFLDLLEAALVVE